MSVPGLTTKYNSLVRNALDRAMHQAMSVRLFVAPTMGALALCLAYFEPVPWRKAMFIVPVGLMLLLSVTEWVRYRRFGLAVIRVPLNVLLTAFAQLLLVTASGGLFSLGTLSIMTLLFTTALLCKPGLVQLALGLILPWTWALAFVHYYDWPVTTLVPELFGGAQSMEHSPAPFFFALLLTLVLGATTALGQGLQRMLNRLYNEAIRERDRSVALQMEQNRSLSLLSSEIAHELKNPLSSLRGLSSLVARDVQGRTAERMAVLQGEVERMQAIVEEFLSFSRPLLPLSLRSADLHELCNDTCQLIEGLALDRGVQLALTGAASCPLRCDPRKVHQVLVNLVQNAVEASPPDSTVTLELYADNELPKVYIFDEGPGLDPDLATRIFEPFVTSKEQGSGLGLVIARALARQHGGDVTLAGRAQGGMVATLVLPREAS